MKENRYEFIQRIPSHYVGNDCVQIMLPHKDDAITILNSEGITYHYYPNSNFYVNKYISDNRKTQFPYSSISTHQARIGLKKVEYVNQLLDFNRVYLQISDNMIVEYFALKDGEEALLASKYILPIQRTEIMNRTQIDELIKTANLGIYNLSGAKIAEYNFISDNELLELYKEQLIAEKQEYEFYNEGKIPSAEIFNKNIENMTPSDIPIQPVLLNNIIIISSDNNEIKSIKYLVVKFKGPDKYIVDIYDFPITIYNLEHMKYLEQTNFRNTPEPVIKKSLNPKTNMSEVKKSKKLILSKKQHNL